MANVEARVNSTPATDVPETASTANTFPAPVTPAASGIEAAENRAEVAGAAPPPESTRKSDTKPKQPRTTKPRKSTGDPAAPRRRKQQQQNGGAGSNATGGGSASGSGIRNLEMSGVPRQTTLTEVVGVQTPPQNTNPHSPNPTNVVGSVEPGITQNGKNEAIANAPASAAASGSQISRPPSANIVNSPASSRAGGQNYDPVRSSMGIHALDNPVTQTPVSPANTNIHTNTNRASASPSISSLIDPPSASPAQRAPPSTLRASPSPAGAATNSNTGPGTSTPPRKPNGTSDSNAPSPKPARTKDTATSRTVPPARNGLLSSTLFGPTSAPGDTDESGRRPTIVLDVPLNTQGYNIVNFARLAEEKYGFDGLHPRSGAGGGVGKLGSALAGLVAAGGDGQGSTAATSADEMSVDMSDGEKDTDMAGAGGGPEGGPGAGGEGRPAKRKRKMKGDEYDREDPFVDDSEMLWEEHAAASKDGFFVYMGPLVPEGEKPVIERADGSTSRRGRGRGRGGRGGGSSRGGASGGGGGDKPRGSTARKPRITKAEKARLEQEKQERERMLKPPE